MVELKQIPVEALVPTRDNPRKVRTDTAEFRELVESVKSVGVLQPLIARPITNGEALRHEHSKKAAQPWPLYDLRAGHRRLEAAKRAGLTSVPVMVHAELDDRTAMEITVTENLQRENLAPLEEARGVKGLLDVGWEVAAIASRLGKSAQWVSRRAKLIDLSPRWVKHVDQGGLCSVWPANLLQIVARLPQHVQNAALEDLECDRSWDDICRDGLPTERELERWIAREYLKTLAAAPFALDNAALLPAAGACTACPKRSGVQASLFDAAEFEEDGPKKKSKKAAPAVAADHCLDQDCYAEKCLAYARSELAAVAKAHGGTALPVLNTRHGGVGYQAAQEFKRCFSKGVLVGNWNSDFEIAPGATPPKGALPGVVCGGPDVGKRVWLVKAKRPSYGGSSGNGAGTHKPAKPAAEVRATRRRSGSSSKMLNDECRMKKAEDGPVRIRDCTLYLGDCGEILPTLESGSIDAVVTDPPYGIGGWVSAPSKWRRKAGLHAERWDEKAADVSALLSLAPVLAIWGGNYYPLPPSRGWLTWHKPDAPPSMAQAEHCWTNQNQNAKLIKHAIGATNAERVGHPTQKPLRVMEWCLKQLPFCGTVLDPFMGSGTTGVACIRTGRRFVGIEIDPHYFAVACKRIEAEYAKTALLEPV